MRIHTDTLTERNVYDAAFMFNLYPEVLAKHGSRKRDHGLEIQISGSSNRDAQSGAWKAATWDEWGAFLGQLFHLDPEMTCTYYDDADDFHRQTCDRFRDGMPQDTHAQHKWVYDYEKSRPWGGGVVHECNKCSAKMTR